MGTQQWMEREERQWSVEDVNLLQKHLTELKYLIAKNSSILHAYVLFTFHKINVMKKQQQPVYGY